MSARKEKDEKKEIPDLRVGVRRLAFGESAHSSLKYQHIIFRVSRRKVYKWHQMAKLPRVAMARFVRMSKSIPTCVSDFVTDCDTSWCSRFGLLSSWMQLVGSFRRYDTESKLLEFQRKQSVATDREIQLA
jgi:hypothetical protein